MILTQSRQAHKLRAAVHCLLIAASPVLLSGCNSSAGQPTAISDGYRNHASAGNSSLLQEGVRTQNQKEIVSRSAEPTSSLSARARLLTSFDGLGASFHGPQGSFVGRNPSDNALAIGPNHIVQIVNSRMAVFTKKGTLFNETGRPLYGPVETSNVWRGFGGPCEEINNGDAVVRYDQLAKRWLIVMPIFTRMKKSEHEPPAPVAGGAAALSVAGRADQPGPAVPLYQPPAPLDGKHAVTVEPKKGDGSYAMCYAVSATPDPLGSWYRYEFVRPLFPDYPRPAVWPDGYYLPSSSGDDVVQKQDCVAERKKMLLGKPAREICIVVDGVNFLNNADIDGTQLPPRGLPNPVVAAGGMQLKGNLAADILLFWKFHADWNHPQKSTLTGPNPLPVARYEYLCGGQLSKCVPQPGVETRLDSQGDKIMQRFVYRRIGHEQSLVATHAIASSLGGGAVRWYEIRLDRNGNPSLRQQGNVSPDAGFRWLPSAAIDRFGDIGIGYSFGDSRTFVGQRFAGRINSDPLGLFGPETILVSGERPQAETLRWEDYTTTAIDPSDDCTMWYVGDYVRAGDTRYSTRIGAFQLGRCIAPR